MFKKYKEKCIWRRASILKKEYLKNLRELRKVRIINDLAVTIVRCYFNSISVKWKEVSEEYYDLSEKHEVYDESIFALRHMNTIDKKSPDVDDYLQAYKQINENLSDKISKIAFKIYANNELKFKCIKRYVYKYVFN